MAMVRTKEQQAEKIAHLLDDILHMPGTSMRIGADPLLGLIPVVGDAIATILGSAILVIARQQDVPWRVLTSSEERADRSGPAHRRRVLLLF